MLAGTRSPHGSPRLGPVSRRGESAREDPSAHSHSTVMDEDNASIVSEIGEHRHRTGPGGRSDLDRVRHLLCDCMPPFEAVLPFMGAHGRGRLWKLRQPLVPMGHAQRRCHASVRARPPGSRQGAPPRTKRISTGHSNGPQHLPSRASSCCSWVGRLGIG